MTTNHRFARGALSVALATAIVGCDGSRGPTNPTAFPTPLLVVEGPPMVGPGESAQFKAILQAPDGGRRDVSAEAAWTSTHPAILAVSPGGVAHGIANGEASIRASFEGRYSVKDAMVIPPGTFRLTGVVLDGSRPVGGAHVRVSGDAAALSTTTDMVTGYYRIYGAPGAFEMSVTSEGYLPSVQTLLISNHRTVDVSLTLAAPPPTVAGTYQLTVTAAAACGTLPAHVRTRTYTAVVEQDGSALAVTLGGADFFVEPWGTLNRFAGGVQPERLVFIMKPPFDLFYLPDIFEIVTASPPTYVALIGNIVAGGTADGYAGRLSGDFEFWTGFQRTASCASAEHGFVLRPVS